MSIAIRRVYDDPGNDGYRVLVDRLWPRGISKDRLGADEWLREVAPSGDLRKAFHAGEVSWKEFRRRYLSELRAHRETLRPLARRASSGNVILLYSARDPDRNNAVVLRQYLAMLKA